MNTKEIVLDILEELTGTEEVKDNLDVDIFEEGLLDSLGTVQLLIELENKCEVNVPVSEFDRVEWATPQKIINQVEALQS